MAFDLKDFTSVPSEVKLGKASKADLQLVAAFCEVGVPVSAKKAEIKELLVTTLRGKGILPDPAGADGGEEVETKDLVIEPTIGSTAEELGLTLCIREVELRK
ncbi:hypothetical protein LDENG_00150480 [Lucifuga dentata]|nr:hypothetical protein LDENG_00150480 [Lucifuga dentata]